MNSLARRLVKELAQFDYSDFPEVVINHAKLLFLDLLGVALGAAHTSEAQGMLKTLTGLGSIRSSGSLLWGTSHFASSGDAALHNGTLAHALELDDFGGADHSGAVIFPALLAVLNTDKSITGKEFIEAVVVGYEVSRRMLEACGGYRAHNSEGGWHSTSTCGAAGAAVAVGKLLKLDEDQMVSALGFATTMTGGTWAFNADGAMSKKIHSGWAAQLGVKSALFAKSGLTGPEFCLEAEWGGFFNTYASGHSTPDELLKDLGVDYKIMRSGIKPYPCCRDNHSTIDIMLELNHSLEGDLEAIKRVEIHCIPEMYKMLSNRHPVNSTQAQFSLPHCAAVALVNGQVEPKHFERDYLSSKVISEMKKKILLVESHDLEFDAEPVCKIELMDGNRLEKSVPFAKGAPQNPLEVDEVVAKFLMLNRDIYSNTFLAKLKDLIFGFEAQDDAGNLQEMLSFTGK